MFYLLIFGFLIFLLIEFWPLFLIVFAVIIIIFIANIISSSRKSSNSYESYETSGICKPKIGTEVSEYFYDEVKQYCRKHHMTISDLIRKAVRAYMDEHR